MKMSRKFKKIFSIFTLVLLTISVSILGFANDGYEVNNEPKEKEAVEYSEIKIYDKNKDKIFDNLEKKLSEAIDTEKFPVIIVFKDTPDKSVNNIDEAIGDCKIKYKYENIPAIATMLDKQLIEKLSKLDNIQSIEYDEPVKAFNDNANYWFGAEKARLDFNLDGNRDGNINDYTKDDVVVAVIDTGIDGNHVDLDNGKIIGWKDFVNNNTTPYDDHGHGTHVSGIIAGEGEGNPDYVGVAKGAALVGVKVLNSQGSGSMSDITAGIDWCITNKDVYGIDVINLSLGTSGSSDGTDSTSLAVNNAVDNGIVVAVAAGNAGPSKYTIGAPGAAEKAITVAAIADVGEQGFNLTNFSSRGPTADGRIKPDISAPGYNISAPQANTTNDYISYSGTSMATPFTAGMVALMLDANPNLSPSDIKNMLLSTADDWGINDKDIDYGNGRLDGYEAIKLAGNYSGNNIVVPNHIHAYQSISSSYGSDIWEFEVDETDFPIAITLIIPDWAKNGWYSTPDFDVYLYDSNGNTLDSSRTSSRQENINFVPSVTGTYKIKVYSYSGTGDYFFDISFGGHSLSLIQDQ